MARQPAARTRRRPGWAALAVTVLALLLLASCASQTSGPGSLGAGGDDAADLADGASGAAPLPATGDGEAVEERTTSDGFVPQEDGGGPLAAPIEQRIVKTGELTLEVANVGESLARVRALVSELGGYVGGSQAGTLDDRATLTLRIPAAAFDEALARLHELDAGVMAEATREEDVTGQVVDLQARIDNLAASEATYRELVARAERIDDILAVQTRLDQVRGEIEQLQAHLEALSGQAELSTLTVTLLPRPAPVQQQTEGWDPGRQLNGALATLVGIGQGLLDGLIWFVVVWLPILLVLAFAVLVALRGVLELRRRLPVAARAEESQP